MTAKRKSKSRPQPARVPRANASLLHVNAENYLDELVGIPNAGIRWVGEPFVPGVFGETDVTKGFAYSGKRALYAASRQVRQRAQIRLSLRYNAPVEPPVAVTEFVYRPVKKTSVRLSDWIIWQPLSSDGETTTGIELRANGPKAGGTYSVDVWVPGRKKSVVHPGVFKGLKQNRWTRFILVRDRSENRIQVWGGEPGSEKFAGGFDDPNADEPVAHARLGDDSDTAIVGSGYWDDIRIGGVLRGENNLRPGEPESVLHFKQPPPVEPIAAGTAKHLFIDKWVIGSTSGVRRTLHAVEKHPANPLIVPEHPWEGRAVLGAGFAIRDPETGLFKMWYKAHCPGYGPPPKRPRVLKRSFTCYAESPDGVHWKKPMFSLNPFGKLKKTNIVLAAHEKDEHEHEIFEPWDMTTSSRAANCIIYNPEHPDPDRRFTALVRLRGFSWFSSPDGIHWTDRGTAFTQAYDSSTTSFDPIRKVHYGSVKLGMNNKRARGYTESADGQTWTDSLLQMTIDKRDHPKDQMYGMDMFYYETIHLCFLRMYRVGLGHRLPIHLLSARDPRHWDRTFRNPFIPCGDRSTCEWDWANQSIVSCPPVKVGDELWFYYSGRTIDHANRDHLEQPLHPDDEDWGRIGLGTLRLDGFVSVDAGNAGGVLETRCLELLHHRLYINADAKGGEIRVELLDAAGKPLPGFKAKDCVPITRNAVKQKVRFNSGKPLPGHGKAIKIKFHLHNASLYAFWTV